MKIPAFNPDKRLWSQAHGFYNDYGVFKVMEDGSAHIYAYRTHQKPDLRRHYATFNVEIRSSRRVDAQHYALTDPEGTRLRITWLQDTSQILVYDHHQKRMVRGDGSSVSRPNGDFLRDVNADTNSVYAASPDAPLLGFPIEIHAPQATPPSARKRAMEFIQVCKTWAHMCDDVIKANGKPIHLKEVLRITPPPNTRTREQNYAVYNFDAATFDIYPDLTFNDLTPLERLTIARKGKTTYPHKTTTLPYALIA